MTILETLKQDHDRFKAIIKQILDTKTQARRVALFKEFKLELVAHSKAEEKVLYKRMLKSDEGKDMALEGTVEHEIADRVVEDLARSRNKTTDEWSARCGVLKELLEHHIDEEENEAFPIAKNLFKRAMLEKMADEFLSEKAKLGVDERAAA